MNVDELKAALGENKDIADFVEAMIKKDVDTQVVGLKSKNTELLDEKKTLQTKLEDIPTDEELAEFKKLKANIDTSAYAKLISEGKMDDVINQKVDRIIKDANVKSAEFRTTIDDLKAQNNKLTQKYEMKIVDDSIRKAAQEGGVTVVALDDVVRRADNIFTMEPDGSVVSRDRDGNLKTTKDEKTLTPKTFIEELKEEAPHFWPQSVSGNLNGSVTEDSLAKTAASGDIDSYLSRRRKQISKTNEA